MSSPPRSPPRPLSKQAQSLKLRVSPNSRQWRLLDLLQRVYEAEQSLLLNLTPQDLDLLREVLLSALRPLKAELPS